MKSKVSRLVTFLLVIFFLVSNVSLAVEEKNDEAKKGYEWHYHVMKAGESLSDIADMFKFEGVVRSKLGIWNKDVIEKYSYVGIPVGTKIRYLLPEDLAIKAELHEIKILKAIRSDLEVHNQNLTGKIEALKISLLSKEKEVNNGYGLLNKLNKFNGYSILINLALVLVLVIVIFAYRIKCKNYILLEKRLNISAKKVN